MMKVHGGNSHEKRLGKLYETIEDIKSSDKVVLPKGMNYDRLKKWIEMMVKDAEPRKLRVEGRTTFDFFDYKIPFNFFGVESNTVNFSLSSGPIFNQDFIGGDKLITKEEIIINDDDGGGGGRGGAVPMTTEIKRSHGKRSKKRVSIITQKSNYTSQIQPNIRSNDYGVMICAHIFKNGRKTIDEMIQDITGIEKHLMTVLINRLISKGYLKKVLEKDKDEQTGKEIEVETLELVLKSEST